MTDDVIISFDTDNDIKIIVPESGTDGRSLNPRGTWNNYTAYVYLDLVTYQGSSYTALGVVPVGTVPTNTAYWQLVAQKGADGASQWGDISGTLSTQTDLQNALNEKANTADLGDLAEKDAVDWDTDIDDIPETFPPQSHTHTVSDVTDFPTLGALATQDTVDYTTDVTNTPTLGTMAAVNDATSDDKEYVRKNGAWAEPTLGGIQTGTISKYGNYYSSMSVQKWGQLKKLQGTLSVNTSYTQLPYNSWQKVGTLPEGYRPAAQTNQVFYCYADPGSGMTPFEIQVQLKTNGEIDLYSYFNYRQSMAFIMFYL